MQNGFIPYTGGAGVYVSRCLEAGSSLALSWRIGTLRKKLAPWVTNKENLHATVMYSKVAPRSTELSSKSVKADITGGDCYGDCYVLTLRSPDLVGDNARWSSIGAVHTFQPYNPHITIIDAARPISKDESILLANYVRRQGLIGMSITFDSETIQDLKP